MIYIGRGILALFALAGAGIGYAIVRDWSPLLSGIVIGGTLLGAGVALGQLGSGIRLAMHDRETLRYAASGKPYIINAGGQLPAPRETMPRLEVVDAWAEEVEV